MDLRITKQTFTQDPEWLMSDHKVHRPGGVTIDASKVTEAHGKKIIKAGTPIGKNIGSGKWEPYKAATTVAAKKATLDIGDAAANTGIRLTAKDAGTAGNDITYATAVTEGPNVTVEVSVAGSAITVRPATTAAAAKAEATTGEAGSNNGLTWTAKAYGKAGDAIVVVLQDPAGNSKDLSIAVNGTTILVKLATGGGGAITTTAAQLITAFTSDVDPAYSAEAAALVVPSNTSPSNGSVAVVDEVVALTGGEDTVIDSSAADVIQAINDKTEAKALVTAAALGESTGAGMVSAQAATNLAGGAAAVETPANVTPTDLLFNTLDVTDGDAAGGSLIHGVVNEERLPVDIDSVCKANMPMIAFLTY